MELRSTPRYPWRSEWFSMCFRVGKWKDSKEGTRREKRPSVKRTATNMKKGSREGCLGDRRRMEEVHRWRIEEADNDVVTLAKEC
jgi:hypothetical protein